MNYSRNIIWRYLTLTVNYNTFQVQVNGQIRPMGDLTQMMDEFGRDGWELVTVVQNVADPGLWGYFFKKPIS